MLGRNARKLRKLRLNSDPLIWLLILGVGCGAIACGASVSGDGDGGPDSGGAAEGGTDGSSCNSSSDCHSDQFCDKSGACTGVGFCRPIPGACPVTQIPVCSCNGSDEPNTCSANVVEKVGVAYGGECRDKAMKSCQAATDCDSSEVCAVDANACDCGTGCTGFCLTATTVSGGPFTCESAGNCGVNSTTETCARASCLDGGAFACDYCVFTSGLDCDGSSDCPTGQLCLEPAGCAASCKRTCAVP